MLFKKLHAHEAKFKDLNVNETKLLSRAEQGLAILMFTVNRCRGEKKKIRAEFEEN